MKPESDGVPIQHVPSALLRWWDAYPTAKTSPPLMTPDDVVTLIRDKTKSESDYAVIDVRRNDHGVSLPFFSPPDMMNPKTLPGRPRSWKSPVGGAYVLR